MYESAFRAADEAYANGRVAATADKREVHWKNWCSFVAPLGVDPKLQDTPFHHRIRCLTGFAALIRKGYYGRGREIQVGSVSGALTAVGQKIALVNEVNPTKQPGSDKFAPRIAEMLAGWGKEDPATMKKLPVEADVPEFLALAGKVAGATELQKAVGDCALIAFYYLCRVGEYTVKKTRNHTKQTKQFELKDCTFFRKNAMGQLRQLSRTAPDDVIMAADSATLKLDNSKNGWKGVCVNQEANGEEFCCAVRAIGRRYCYIRKHAGGDRKAYLSAYWVKDKRKDVNDEDMRENLKWAATELDYPCRKGIPIERVDTHSLRIGGANALSLSGYSDREIQKMGRWRGETFKEYIREQLDVFSKGMSKNMKQKFNFVNVEGGVNSDIVEVLDITKAVLLTRPNAAACAA